MNLAKKITVMLLVVSMVFGMSACSSDSKSTDETMDGTDVASTTEDGERDKDSLTYGWIIHNIDQFQTELFDEAAAFAKQQNIELTMYDSREDIATQLSQIEACSAAGFDGCVVIPVASDTGPELVQAAGDMPIVFANQMATDLSLYDGVNCTFVGTKEEEAGKNQGKFLADYFKEQGTTDIKAVLFMGPLGVDAVIKRTESVKQALKDEGINVEYVFEDTAEWDRAKSMDKMIQFMGSGAQYDCVISNNDDMALGVIEAYSSVGKDIDVPIVGVDATKVGRQAVKDGTLSCTVFQNPIAIGQGAITALTEIVNGQKVSAAGDDGIAWVPYELVTIDNVNELG